MASPMIPEEHLQALLARSTPMAPAQVAQPVPNLGHSMPSAMPQQVQQVNLGQPSLAMHTMPLAEPVDLGMRGRK